MLPTSADGPAECLDLMSMTFRCMALDVMAKTPQYGQWLFDDATSNRRTAITAAC